MDILPAVDILNGRCVRLAKGRYAKQTIYSEDPLSVAKKWINSGALWLHIVDLDGAKTGKPLNIDIIKKIISYCKSRDIKISIGGGIRDSKTITLYKNFKVDRVNIGTALIKEIKEKGRITILKNLSFIEKYLALDCKKGVIRIAGWLEDTQLSIKEVIELIDSYIDGYLVTAIERDGMLKGPDIKLIKQVSKITGKPIIAAGGIRSIKDILNLKRLNIAGVIVGKSLYENKIDLKEAINACA
ncbi:MAG: 1-(5-phosphoribosyl)-5-[(5-phosphoribosylamino)methylideneamino] imidazole-4-carboxamide isomerase [Candidatus Hydrogenedentota bacterium]